MPNPDSRIPPWAWVLLATAPPFWLHVRTVCPTAYGDFDSAEFATAIPMGGVPHAPGYPLYLLFARAVSAFFPGNPALGVNVASALAAAIGVAALFAWVERITGDRSAALVAGWTLGASFTYWSMAVVAEVYVLQAALGLLLLVTLACENLPWFALVLGLAYANHPSSVLITPGLLLHVGASTGLRKRLLAAPAGYLALFASPGLLYLYLVFCCHFSSHPGFWVRELGIDLARPADLLWYLSLQAYPPALYDFRPQYLRGEFPFLLGCLLKDFSEVGSLLGLIGLVVLFRRSRLAGASLLLMLSAQMTFYLGFTASDKFTMFCPAFALFAAGIGIGVAEVLLLAGGYRTAVVCLLSLLPGSLLLRHYPQADRSHYSASRDYARAALCGLEPNAVVMAGWQAATVLDYFATLDRGMVGLDLRHHQLALLAASRRLGTPLGDLRSRDAVAQELVAAVQSGRPVYAAFGTPELAAQLDREPAGLLYRLHARRAPDLFPSAPVSWPVTPAASFVDADLLELAVEPPALRAGQQARLKYRWRLREARALDRQVSTVLIDAASGAALPLGHEARPSQVHRLGMLRRAGAAGSFVEEQLDFTLPPAGSETEIPAGGYLLAVRLDEGRYRMAARLKVLAPAAPDRP